MSNTHIKHLLIIKRNNRPRLTRRENRMCHIRALQHRQLHRLANGKIRSLQEIRQVALRTRISILRRYRVGVVELETRGVGWDGGHPASEAGSLDGGTLVACEQRGAIECFVVCGGEDELERCGLVEVLCGGQGSEGKGGCRQGGGGEHREAWSWCGTTTVSECFYVLNKQRR